MKWLFFLFALPLFGFYIGNPADPALMNTGFFSLGYPFFKATSGYLYDSTTNKRYASSSEQEAIRRFGLHSQMASVSLLFIERLQLFAYMGGSKEIIDESPSWQSLWKLHTGSHFSWGAGGKAILFQWAQTFLTLDLSFFELPSSERSFFKYLNQFGLPLSSDKKKLSLNEWQSSLGLASRLLFLTPYGGINYLHSRLHAEQTYQNLQKWGYFYGISVSLSGRLHLNFERRVRNEFAYSFATTAVF